MSFLLVGIKCFVPLVEKGVEAALEQGQRAPEGEGLFRDVLGAASRFSDGMVKQGVDDGFVRHALVFESFHSSLDRAIRKLTMLVRPEVTECIVVVCHGTSISDLRPRMQFCQWRGLV